MKAIINVIDVAKHFGQGQIKALDGVSFQVDEGESLAVVGPSGCGKSIADERDLASFRRRTVGFVFQLHNLIPALAAWENVQVPLMEQRMSPRARRQRALELLAEVGLSDRATSLLGTSNRRMRC